MYRGWLYLVVVMDWFSRYVPVWEVSVTLESQFAVSALKQALSFGKPEIFNTDQGSQFASNYDWDNVNKSILFDFQYFLYCIFQCFFR